MTKLLLSLVVLLQANPTGAVTGVVRNNMGMPAAGVRVYAMAVRELNEGANTEAVLESISQTDESGRYHLDVPAGRYYIAAGSVGAPTYFPGTSDVKGALVISIASSTVVASIDFPGFVPASSSPAGMTLSVSRPGSTGVLSGVIRYPDGSPAAGLSVSVTPASFANSAQPTTPSQPTLAQLANNLTIRLGAAVAARAVQTDSTGRYRFDNLPPETYYIAAGFAESPTFYPGVTDVAAAATLATTPATNLDTLHFTMSPPPKETTLSGTVSAAAGMPAGGVTVRLRMNPSGPVSLLLPARPFQQAISKPDGSFEIVGVVPGRYALEARLAGANPVVRSIVVADQPVEDVQLSFPVATLSGRILWEDGSPFPDVQALREVAVVTGPNSNRTVTTIFPIDGAGRFSRVIEGNEYRFFLRILPDDYTIKSITSDGVDLLKELLRISSNRPVSVEVRMAKRTETAGTKVRGRVLDSVTGKPAVADTVLLCCMAMGPFERLATHLQQNGSFEFKGAPPGAYTAELRSRPGSVLVANTIEVGTGDVSGITLASASELIPVSVLLTFEDGNLAAASGIAVVFTGASEVVPVEAKFGANAPSPVARVAVGDRYKVTVSNVPDGYVVKSIAGGDGNLMNGGRLSVTKGSAPAVVITLGKGLP